MTACRQEYNGKSFARAYIPATPAERRKFALLNDK